MSDIKKKKFDDIVKENTNESKKSFFKIKNNKISSKKGVRNNKNKSNKIKKISINKGNNNKLNIHKTIMVDRKLNTSMSSRNKNDLTMDNSYRPPNDIVSKKDFSLLLIKKLEKKNNNNNNTNNNKKNHSNNYIQNNNYINIKNIRIENKINKKEYFDDNYISKNKNKDKEKKGMDIEYINSHSLTKITNIDNENIDNIKNIYNNNLITNNIININGFISEKRIRQIYSKHNNNYINDDKKNKIMDKSVDIFLIDSHPSLSNLSSIHNNSKTINAAANNSSSAKDIIRHYKKYNFNHNTIYDDTINKKQKMKSKNISIKIGNKNNNYIKIQYQPNSFFKGSRSVYNLSVESNNNKINKIYENKDRRNNSISFRNRRKSKLKGIDSTPLLFNKLSSPQIKKLRKNKIKITKKNNESVNNFNKIKNKYSNRNLVTKKNSANNFNNISSTSSTKKHKNYISDKTNINNDEHTNTNVLKNKKKKIPKIIKKKEDNNNKINHTTFITSNSINDFKKEKEKNKRTNKNNNHIIKFDSKKNNKNKIIYDIKSPVHKEEENEKEIFTSPVSSTRHSYSNKFAIKEYPNMALSTSKKIECEITKKFEKKIKKIQFLCKVGSCGSNQKKLNQDNYFIHPNFLNNPSYSYIGVCDGHGIFGQNISCYLQEHLPKNVQESFIDKNITNLSNEKIDLISQTIENIYEKTNIEMNEDERIDSSFSGSTSVSIIFTPDRIICINVGDSRCVLGKYNKKYNEWLSMNLSRDHKPADPDEKARIIKNGGRVEPYIDDEGNYIGPERVWVKNEDNPGLAMSRSFGDEVAHKVGVIVSPEIYDYHMVEDDKFIILASDGIWEFISSDEAVDIVKLYYLNNDLEGALNYLYNESVKRWVSKENIIDDITVIIAFLD